MRLAGLGLSCAFLLACPSAPAVESKQPVPSPVRPALRTDHLSAAKILAGEHTAWSEHQSSIVAFGASWCEPCWVEWTELSKAALPEGIRVFLVLSEPEGEGRARVLDWARRVAPGFTLLADPDGTISDAWKVKDFPALLVWKQKPLFEHQGYDPEVVARALATLRVP